MERILFEIAKALKEAGYPQDCYNEYWVKFKNKPEPLIINGDEAHDLYENINDETDENYVEDYYAIIEYLEVWLWLWREKKISIMISQDGNDNWEADVMYGKAYIVKSDPEEAIIAAIKYLVDNNLIK